MREWIENEWLIPALSYGMTMDEFWRHTPRTLTLWFKGREMQERIYHNIKDTENHQLGVYICRAIAACLDNKSKYPQKALFQVDTSSQQDEEERLQRERNRVIAFFNAWGNAVNKKFKKNG